MAISFSRPDPSSPAAVGSAQFTIGRRGFEQEEVRDFLRMVSAELARLQERERFLESELRVLQTQGISSPGVLDEETVMRVLGEETARVLTAAREAAQQMRLRASESADRIVREATADAARLRNDAEIEVSRQRADAIADSEAEIELAKQQGREMVAEARAYREKVLSELSRRRELAREQIEHLIHHRDRLATAFERARLAATDVVGDLDEFDELADEIEQSAGLLSGVKTPTFVDHTADPEAIPQRAQETDVVIEMTIETTDDSTASPSQDETLVGEKGEVGSTEANSLKVGAQRPESSEETPSQSVKAEHPSNEPASGHMAEVVHLFGSKKSEGVPQDSKEPVGDESLSHNEDPTSDRPASARKKSVDELFAKLRESRVEDVARVITEPIQKAAPTHELPTPTNGLPKAVIPQFDREPFELRKGATTAANIALGRCIKKVLADLENSALTLLQTKKYVLNIETIIPSAEDVTSEVVGEITTELMNVALIGAQSVARGLKSDLRKKVTQSEVVPLVASQVSENLSTPLRSRLERSIEQCNGDVAEMASLTRSTFREFKLQRIESVVSDLTLLAFSRGVFLALPNGSKICWMVDPEGPSCADAEDNSLAGTCLAGEPFPTGHLHPTAHSGCRCLLGISK